jgi:hypothetical protein
MREEGAVTLGKRGHTLAHSVFNIFKQNLSVDCSSDNHQTTIHPPSLRVVSNFFHLQIKYFWQSNLSCFNGSFFSFENPNILTLI